MRLTGLSTRRVRAAVIVVVALVAALVGAVSSTPVSAAAGDIVTVAGGGEPEDGIGDGLPATSAALRAPWGVDEVAGELYITEGRPGAGAGGGRLRKVDLAGTMSTLAGGGTPPLGDGGPGAVSTLNFPEGVMVDADGDLYIADERNQRVRRVDAGADGVVDGDADETIVTVAGTGTAGFAGDGGPATAAELSNPLRVAFDSAANMFISDSSGARVRKVVPGADGEVDGDADELITTVAGNGTSTSSGDGGPAAAAQLNPRGLAVDAANNLYIADVGSFTVRVITAGADGEVDGTDIITTYAGGGDLPMGAEGEGAPATDASIPPPEGLDFDAAGNLFISAVGEPRILRVDTTGHIMTVAGTGENGNSGDGGPATAAQFGFVFGLTVDADGNVYTADVSSNTVRRISPGADGVVDGDPDDIVTPFAGTGTFGGSGGDGRPATAAPLRRPADVAAGPGGVFIAEADANRVRRVDPAGIISTVAGGGIGDGLPAVTSSLLADPRGVVVDAAGTVFIADCGHQRVRKLDPGGVITTYVGGTEPFQCPSGLHLVTSGPAAGTLYVADAGSHRVFRVDPGGGVSIVAGTGTAGFSGDGAAAGAAQLNGPSGVFVDTAGSVFLADTDNHRVRRIDAVTGVIVTVAGNGGTGFGQNGIGATRTSVSEPTDMVLDPSGNLIVAEQGFHRLRLVTPGPDGIVNGKRGEQITTIAGSGIPSFGGDGGPAASAALNLPTQLDLDGPGNILFTDLGNGRVRRIEAGTPALPPPNGCGQVITTDTVLTADIGPCPGDGVVIGSGGITLDLNGHTISGTDGSTGNVGIKLEARRNVTVRGRALRARGHPMGTVRGFDAGVVITGGQGNDIRELQIRDNIGFDTYGDGVAVFFSNRNRILNNVLDGNGVYDGIGILGVGAHDNVVRGNLVARTRSMGAPPPVGIGIALNPFVSELLPREQSIVGNRIESNTIRENDNSGISNISNINGSITGNLVENNGQAPFAQPANGIGINSLELASANTNVLVQNNTVLNNGSRMPDGSPFVGDGINIVSNENHVLNNEVHGNRNSGIRIQATQFTGKRNEIRDNNAADNGPPGFFAGDLVDTHADFDLATFTQIFHCDENVWFGNIWGSGGYWPDPAFNDPEGGILIPEACTAIGGHPQTGIAAASADDAIPGPRAIHAQKRAVTPKYRDLDRGHPPMPG